MFISSIWGCQVTWINSPNFKQCSLFRVILFVCFCFLCLFQQHQRWFGLIIQKHWQPWSTNDCLNNESKIGGQPSLFTVVVYCCSLLSVVVSVSLIVAMSVSLCRCFPTVVFYFASLVWHVSIVVIIYIIFSLAKQLLRHTYIARRLKQFVPPNINICQSRIRCHCLGESTQTIRCNVIATYNQSETLQNISPINKLSMIVETLHDNDSWFQKQLIVQNTRNKTEVFTHVRKCLLLWASASLKAHAPSSSILLYAKFKISRGVFFFRSSLARWPAPSRVTRLL